MNSTLCTICTATVDLVRSESQLINASVAVLTNITKELCYSLGTHIIYKECDYISSNIQKNCWLDMCRNTYKKNM